MSWIFEMSVIRNTFTHFKITEVKNIITNMGKMNKLGNCILLRVVLL